MFESFFSSSSGSGNSGGGKEDPKKNNNKPKETPSSKMEDKSKSKVNQPKYVSQMFTPTPCQIMAGPGQNINLDGMFVIETIDRDGTLLLGQAPADQTAVQKPVSSPNLPSNHANNESNVGRTSSAPFKTNNAGEGQQQQQQANATGGQKSSPNANMQDYNAYPGGRFNPFMSPIQPINTTYIPTAGSMPLPTEFRNYHHCGRNVQFPENPNFSPAPLPSENRSFHHCGRIGQFPEPPTFLTSEDNVTYIISPGELSQILQNSTLATPSELGSYHHCGRFAQIPQMPNFSPISPGETSNDRLMRWMMQESVPSPNSINSSMIRTPADFPQAQGFIVPPERWFPQQQIYVPSPIMFPQTSTPRQNTPQTLASTPYSQPISVPSYSMQGAISEPMLMSSQVHPNLSNTGGISHPSANGGGGGGSQAQKSNASPSRPGIQETSQPTLDPTNSYVYSGSTTLGGGGGRSTPSGIGIGQSPSEANKSQTNSSPSRSGIQETSQPTLDPSTTYSYSGSTTLGGGGSRSITSGIQSGQSSSIPFSSHGNSTATPPQRGEMKTPPQRGEMKRILSESPNFPYSSHSTNGLISNPSGPGYGNSMISASTRQNTPGTPLHNIRNQNNTYSISGSGSNISPENEEERIFKIIEKYMNTRFPAHLKELENQGLIRNCNCARSGVNAGGGSVITNLSNNPSNSKGGAPGTCSKSKSNNSSTEPESSKISSSASTVPNNSTFATPSKSSVNSTSTVSSQNRTPFSGSSASPASTTSGAYSKSGQSGASPSPKSTPSVQRPPSAVKSQNSSADPSKKMPNEEENEEEEDEELKSIRLPSAEEESYDEKGVSFIGKDYHGQSASAGRKGSNFF